MALIGNVDSQYGVSGDYNIIKRFVWDKFEKCEVCVASYLSEDARNNLKQPLKLQSYYVDNSFADDHPTMTELYDALKLLEDFSDMTSDNV